MSIVMGVVLYGLVLSGACYLVDAHEQGTTTVESRGGNK